MSLTRTAGGGGKKKGGLSASSSRGGLSSSSSRFSLDRNPSQQLLSRNPSHVMSQNNLHALQPPSPGVQMDMQSALADLANAIDGSAEVTHSTLCRFSPGGAGLGLLLPEEATLATPGTFAAAAC